ncbi:MAG: type II toxin-antitoxin system PemK/MazF family toxin [Sporichthyaceae bacterium]
MRGDIYRLKAPRGRKGHEQGGVRYGVVLQSDDLPLSTWLVAPTSTSARPASFRPELTIEGTRTVVQTEQLKALDPQSRLGERIGRVSAGEMAAISSALRVVLDL